MGTSPPRTTAPASSASARRPPAPSPIPSDFRTVYVKVSSSRFLSPGHAPGRWEAELYVSPDGQAAWKSGRDELPVGARAVEEHFEKAGTPGPLYMMEKREAGFDPTHGDVRYVVVDPKGVVLEDGPLASCAGCHDEAPHGHLFRPEE